MFFRVRISRYERCILCYPRHSVLQYRVSDATTIGEVLRSIPLGLEELCERIIARFNEKDEAIGQRLQLASRWLAFEDLYLSLYCLYDHT